MKTFFELRESLQEAKIEVGDRVRVKDDAKKVVDRGLLGKSGVVVPNPMGGRSIRVKFVDGRSAMFNKNDLEVNESVELDEAKGTDVKKFVKGMRVAKTSNPDMKGTVIKGGDNLKKGVEVEWDSGTTTVASGKYLMSIKKNESVELGESALDKQWQSGKSSIKSGSVELIRGKSGVHTIKKGGKTIGDFSLDYDDWVVNIKGKKGQHTLGSIDDIVKMASSMKESVALGEARKDAAADLYFDTYSAAIQKAINDTFKKHKLEVDAEDYYQKVNMGPGKPGRGKTTRHTLDLVDIKTGKPSRKRLHIQVYNRETAKNPYELNFYVS